NPDPLVDDLQPGQGWQMTASASPTPDSWVLPAGATGDTATTTADAAGFATFQWNTATPGDSNFTIAEAIQPGYTNDQTKTRCTSIRPDITTPTPLPNFTVTNGGFSGSVPDDAIATCDLINRLVPTPGVSLVKSTNGADANDAPGPSIPVGSPVTWSYLVTN